MITYRIILTNIGKVTTYRYLGIFIVNTKTKINKSNS